MASVGEVAALVGVDEDAISFLEGASPADLESLGDAIAAAGRARDAELREAVDNALKFIPRPLRGRVVKMLGGGRG